MEYEDPFVKINAKLNEMRADLSHISYQLEELKDAQNRRSTFFQDQGREVLFATRACLFMLVIFPLAVWVFSLIV